MNIFEEVFQNKEKQQVKESNVPTEEFTSSGETTVVPTENEKQEFDLEQWKKEKKSIRDDVYGMLESITSDLMAGEVDIRQYLNVQAQFMEYSASNALLILAQNANAQKLGSAIFWKDHGAILKPNAEHIYILEKTTGWQKRDGTIADSYDPVRMFDISQTNIKPNNEKPKYTQRSMLFGLVKDCKYLITTQENLSLPVLVEDNTIYYRKNIDFEEGFAWLVYVLAALSMDQSNKTLLDYKARCVSYIICTNFGIQFEPDSEWNDGNPLLHFEKPKEFRNQLKEIRNTASVLYNNILSEAEIKKDGEI